METREKARELVEKFIEYTKEWDELDGYVDNEYTAKQCALIAVEEILQADGWSSSRLEWDMYSSYWNKVKHEIEKLC